MRCSIAMNTQTWQHVDICLTYSFTNIQQFLQSVERCWADHDSWLSSPDFQWIMFAWLWGGTHLSSRPTDGTHSHSPSLKTNGFIMNFAQFSNKPSLSVRYYLKAAVTYQARSTLSPRSAYQRTASLWRPPGLSPGPPVGGKTPVHSARRTPRGSGRTSPSHAS